MASKLANFNQKFLLKSPLLKTLAQSPSNFETTALNYFSLSLPRKLVPTDDQLLRKKFKHQILSRHNNVNFYSAMQAKLKYIELVSHLEDYGFSYFLVHQKLDYDISPSGTQGKSVGYGNSSSMANKSTGSISDSKTGHSGNVNANQPIYTAKTAADHLNENTEISNLYQVEQERYSELQIVKINHQKICLCDLSGNTLFSFNYEDLDEWKVNLNNQLIKLKFTVENEKIRSSFIQYTDDLISWRELNSSSDSKKLNKSSSYKENNSRNSSKNNNNNSHKSHNINKKNSINSSLNYNSFKNSNFYNLDKNQIILQFYCVGYKAKILQEFIGGYVFMCLKKKKPEMADEDKLKDMICKI